MRDNACVVSYCVSYSEDSKGGQPVFDDLEGLTALLAEESSLAEMVRQICKLACVEGPHTPAIN